MGKKLRGNDFFKLLDRYIGIPLVWFLGLWHGISSAPSNPASILVIKLSAIGDTILLYPALRLLRERYPKARISFVCTRINRAIVDNCPYIDDAVEVNVSAFVRKPWKSYSSLKKIRAEIAIDFDQWTRLSAVITWAGRAPFRIGFRTEGQGRHFLYTRSVKHDRGVHEVDAFVGLLSALGIIAADRQVPEFPVSPAAMDDANRILAVAGLKDAEPYIVMHPETPAHGRQRQWPVENYEILGKILSAETGIRVLISGVASETAEKTALAKAIGASARVLPPVSITVYAAVLSRARLLVCGNTGVMHLACAVGTPVVGLHGPTNAGKWGPRSPKAETVESPLPCSPCLYLGFEYGCAENKCMRAITVAEVAEKSRKHCILHE